MNDSHPLLETFRQTDIALLDQILKGRFRAPGRVLDAGCGSGRNLLYFLQEGFDACALDENAAAVRHVCETARRVAPHLPEKNFRAESIEAHTFRDGTFDLVLCIAVLHFARDHDHFNAMLDGVWRLVRPGGILFCRLASSIGIEPYVTPVSGGRYHLGDGSIRYLVDLAMLTDFAATHNGDSLEPIKTVNVQNQRCMTTWVIKKRHSGRHA